MRLPKDLLSGNYIKPRIFLCEVDKERICQLETTNTNGSFKFNSYSEISFEINRLYNNLITGETKINPHYNKIESPRLIELENFGYFELQGPELNSDGIQEKKTCTAYSLEYSLSTKYLTDFIVNTGEIGSVEVTYAEDVLNDINKIQPVTLYNPTTPELSLLHLALKPIRGWSIGHVDTSLQTLSRQFEIDRESVYDFLMNEMCEKFNCYIVFDTINNKINVYTESLTSKFIGDGTSNTFIITPPFAQIGTVSVGGYKTTRWIYNSSTGALTLEDVPESGSHIEIVDGALTEWETDVFVTFDNLTQEISVNYDADAIKTQLTVSYGDDGDIRETNFGLPYLVDISYYYTVDWMGQDLYDAYTAYMQKSNGLQVDYTDNSQEILKINDKIYYEETRLSLEFSLAQSVNSTTVGTYYIRQGETGNYYYKEVVLPGEYDANETYYSNATVNVTEDKITKLFNVLKKYFNNENNDGDDYTSWKTDLNSLSSEFEFMETYTLNYLSTELSKVSNDRTNEYKNSTATIAIGNFLSEIWTELGRTPLEKLYLEPYQEIKATNIEAGWSNKNDEKYGYYYPVLLMIGSIELAISIRNTTISGYEKQRQVFYDANDDIRDSLAMDNNFTDQQLIRLSAFLREDELHLDDIIETSEDNLSSSFKVKQDAMESGRIELQKLCQPQLQFSMSMANIYALPEFEPIIEQFQLGKVIKVGLRSDYIKQSRLLQIDINFDDFSDFSCEFGDLTSLRSQSDIHADLLKNAITAGKSVATNSGRWTHGSDIATSIDLKIQKGLLDATTQIKAIDGNQGVVIDKYGIWLKKNNEDGSVSPYQTRLVNNMILMSDDGFKTSKTALGQVTVDGQSYYGLISEIMLAGYIEGTTIRGGTIGIGEYIDPKDNKTKHHFEVDKDGNVTMNAEHITINGYATSGDVSKLSSRIDVNEGNISLVVSDGKINTASIVTSINDGESNVGINADRIVMTGTTTFLKPEDVGENGSTVISGSRITTGEIDARKVTVKNLQASSIIVKGNETVSDALSNTLVSSVTYYALSTSTKIPPEGNWSEEPPEKERNKYMWQKTVDTYGDGTSEEKIICIAGADGVDGNGILEQTQQYYESASDTNLVDGEWFDEFPESWDGTTYIWTRIKNVWTQQDEDGAYTITYTNSQLMSRMDMATIAAQKSGKTLTDWCIENNVSIIDGATIATGSITAKQLAVDAITSNNYVKDTSGSQLNLADGTFDSKNFKISSAGDITANGGNIAGWTINNTLLYKESVLDDGTYRAYLQAPSSPSSTSSAFAIGKTDSNGAKTWPFSIAYNGKLTAKNADITGKITADSGSVAGWNVDGESLYSKGTDGYTIMKSNGYVAFATGVPSSNSVSDTSGASFQIYHNGKINAAYNGSSYNFVVSDDGNVKITGDLVLKNSSGSAKLDGERLQLKASSTEWFEAWPSSSDKSCMLSGRNGIIITDTKDSSNNTIAQFSTDNIQLIGDSIVVKDNGTANTCNMEIWGGLEVSSYNSSDNKWYYSMDVNQTGKGGGKLLGTWKTNDDVAITSDINKKHSVERLPDNYNVLFDQLQPIRYKYNHGTSDRYHTGFIAQDVEQSLATANLESSEFAGFLYDQEEDACYLRYSEFIALNTWQIQKAKARITELEEKVAKLEALINKE